MAYKDLVLTFDQIMNHLVAYADPNTIQKQEKGNGTHFSFKKDGKDVLLVAFKNKKGLMTLSSSQGANNDISEKIAKDIVENISKPVSKNVTITIERCNLKSVEELISYLVGEQHATIHDTKENENAHATIWTLDGIEGDSLTFSFFETTQKLLIQGRPAFLIQEAISYIGTWDFITDEMHVQHINKVFDMQCALETIKDRAQADYPHLYLFSDSSMKKILNTAIQIQQTNVPYEDPCILLFSPLRAMECFIKSLFYKKNITITTQPFQAYFERNAQKSTFKIKENYEKIIDSKEYCDAIGECFSFYTANRHSAFHGSGQPGLTKILDQASALSIAQRALSIMETHCKIIENLS